ncbi:phosphoethanolamine N-methyltransferase 1-like [Bradysia coprophila]|uniref:phosphoethanolamine N-methyltransferase 1-like n=1 Tax=Bradysia coprophila TaxID=38358 RepID=UPI00187D7CB9|nr:phosphoethanolamine N-methyltransferase 1-like [Bradysia coprophila]
MAHSSDSSESFQAFLDGQQYTVAGIRHYEYIFGRTYVSTGGENTTKEFVAQLNLKEGDEVLDIGCGIGGSAFYMARTYKVNVHGIDLSANMIGMAKEYREEMEDSVRKNVNFEVSDITVKSFEPGTFDVVYSRDSILHIRDKEQLFANCFKWLKPGGRLMISDYCHGDKDEHSKDFTTYVKDRGYHLLTVKAYGNLLKKVGFTNVVADDRTRQFIDILNVELNGFNERKSGFLQQFEEHYFDYIVNGWEAKVVRCTAGDQAWGLFTAKKPFV